MMKKENSNTVWNYSVKSDTNRNKKGGNNRKTGGEGGEVVRSPNAQKLHEWVAVNERGARIGESHPRAVLSDRDVELLLELRTERYSYAWLAEKFEISKAHAWRICTGRKRDQIPATFRRARRG